MSNSESPSNENELVLGIMTPGGDAPGYNSFVKGRLIWPDLITAEITRNVFVFLA